MNIEPPSVSKLQTLTDEHSFSRGKSIRKLNIFGRIITSSILRTRDPRTCIICIPVWSENAYPNGVARTPMFDLNHSSTVLHLVLHYQKTKYLRNRADLVFVIGPQGTKQKFVFGWLGKILSINRAVYITDCIIDWYSTLPTTHYNCTQK